jgi:hypothetical protein
LPIIDCDKIAKTEFTDAKKRKGMNKMGAEK